MIKRVTILVALLLSTGCAAPKLPLLSEVDMAEESNQNSLAIPSGNDPAPESLQGELAETEVQLSTEDQAKLEAQRKNARGGLFGLFRRQSTPETLIEVAPASAQDEAVESITDAAVDAGEIDQVTTLVEVSTAEETQDVAQQTPTPQEEQRPRRKGLFGIFGEREDRTEIVSSVDPETQAAENVAENSPESPIEATAEAEGEIIVVASLSPEEPRQPRRGLFGRRAPKANGSREVIPDEALVFGQVGIACGVRGRKLGKPVDQFAQSGTDFKLYDTNPGSLEPRLHYITGFTDGCPRKFIAALALLGSPQLHETMRYDVLNRGLPYSETDTAYEDVKRQVCRTGRNKPCPENYVAKMEASTAFITYYERFGDTRRWAEILLYKGKVAASSTRAR